MWFVHPLFVAARGRISRTPFARRAAPRPSRPSGKRKDKENLITAENTVEIGNVRADSFTCKSWNGRFNTGRPLPPSKQTVLMHARRSGTAANTQRSFRGRARFIWLAPRRAVVSRSARIVRGQRGRSYDAFHALGSETRGATRNIGVHKLEPPVCLVEYVTCSTYPVGAIYLMRSNALL